MRYFVCMDLSEEPVPDETTILNFIHQMKHQNLGDEISWLVNVYLAEIGLKVNRGAIVDAAVINTPTATMNKDNARDPDMHQTRKSNQWSWGEGQVLGRTTRPS